MSGIRAADAAGPSPVTTVFLHGFSGDRQGLRRFADAYAGTDSICVNMPGCGGSPVPEGLDVRDIREYGAVVWAEIRRVVPTGPVNLVGHSHGAMVGYTIAVEHPDEVARLDLLCPVVRPRLVPRLTIHLIRLLSSVGVAPSFLARLAAHPLCVSLVSRYTSHPDWSAETRAQVAHIRQGEAKFYSATMFRLAEQTLIFARIMDGSSCNVPTKIGYALDENVAGKTDHDWYARRSAVMEVRQLSGGHLCVVAEPDRMVTLLRSESGMPEEV